MLVEKFLKLDPPVAERFYILYREQFNSDLTVPKPWSKNGFPERLVEQKKKSPPSRDRSSTGSLPKEPDADH
jgi:hypothetical protein